MKRILYLLLICTTLSCGNKELIYNNDSYSLYTDKVVQGEFMGVAESPDRIVSNLDGEEYVWEKKNELDAFPKLVTPFLIEEAVYNIGLDECVNAVEPNGTLRTGLEWGGVWTRDVSYSTILSMSYIQPKAAMKSLLCKVNSKGEIIQDTGTGGAWPCSTDREIWVGAAWEIYKVTGDIEWLRKVYPVAKRSLEVDIRTIFEKESGLFKGESSFIDWRKQSYPRWMEAVDIYDSKCIGTNMVFYIALTSAAEMGRILGDNETAHVFEQQALELKQAINEVLWVEDKGYYAQYLAGKNDDLLYSKSETLGQSLAILYEVAEAERAERISELMPVVDLGAPVFWPWIPDIQPYHNRAVWPFVQSYWVLASAKTGNEQGVLHGISSVWRAVIMYATNKENFVANTGDWKGTQINSSNMLWSLSGNLGITFRVLMGMNYTANELEFAPVVPCNLKADRKIKNYSYRDATLDIEVCGFGDSIKRFILDGKEVEKASIPADIKGHHTIKIVMSDSFRKKMVTNHQSALCTPMTPFIRLSGKSYINWFYEEGVHHYDVYAGGKKVLETKDRIIKVGENWNGDIQIVAVTANGVSSFPSNPLNLNKTICFDFKETLLTKGNATNFNYTIDVPEDGIWTLSWFYANGNGPDYTGSTCGIRMLYVNGEKVGINIFPNRGGDEWDNWGWTIPEKLNLKAGKHVITLKYESDADNMAIGINDFKIKKCRIVKTCD